VSEKNADFQPETNRVGSGRSSESNWPGLFLAELGRLKRIVAGMGLSASDGEDVIQDVSMQLLSRRAEYRNEQEAVKWLTRVTVNRCLMEHRRRRSFRRHAPEILRRRSEVKAVSIKVDEKAIVAEEIEIVRECLAKLDGSLLMPLVLRYFCGLNSKEVGEVLDLSPSTVRSRLRDARLFLAKTLIERGVEP